MSTNDEPKSPQYSTHDNSTGPADGRQAPEQAIMQDNDVQPGTAQPGSTAPSDQDVTAQPEYSWEQLQSELEQARDRALRAHAELENYRRRMQREMAEQRRFAEQHLIFHLLPVVDNLERALQSQPLPESTENALLQGVRMVADQLLGILERHHCHRIEAEGQPFDPACHQATAQQPTGDYPPGTVIHVHQHGYRLHDRVIRAAQVVVAAPPAADGAIPAAEQEPPPGGS